MMYDIKTSMKSTPRNEQMINEERFPTDRLSNKTTATTTTTDPYEKCAGLILVENKN